MTTDEDWARLRPLGYYPDERATTTGRDRSEPEIQNLPGSGGAFVARILDRRGFPHAFVGGPGPETIAPCEHCGVAFEPRLAAAAGPGTLRERILRLQADAEKLAVDLRDARNAAPLGEKGPYRYSCRHIEHAVELIRKAGQ